MIRTFLHSFNPAQLNPIPGDTVDLDVSEIENAGIREVLQTPGTAYGAWSIIDALLTPTGAGTPFIFKEPLGHAREVKVALSGLFGRFVARAYLERYFNIKIFAHLGGRTIDLDRRLKVRVRRLSRGDLPDWVACTSNLSDLTVAEAKGCHDGSGPASALRRAWRQAKRINITAGAQKISVKRIAIATRWGIASPRPTDAYISVRDPIEEGDRIRAEESDAVFAGLLRLHIANLIRGLGHAELANALCRLTQQGSARSLRDEVVRAVSLLDSTRTYEAGEIGRLGSLVGGVITRAGPIADTTIAPADQKALAHLNLRPVSLASTATSFEPLLTAISQPFVPESNSWNGLTNLRGRMVPVAGLFNWAMRAGSLIDLSKLRTESNEGGKSVAGQLARVREPVEAELQGSRGSPTQGTLRQTGTCRPRWRLRNSHEGALVAGGRRMKESNLSLPVDSGFT